MADSCSVCRFFYPNPNPPGGGCRRFPPVFIERQRIHTGDREDVMTIFAAPQVGANYWCGEFQQGSREQIESRHNASHGIASGMYRQPGR